VKIREVLNLSVRDLEKDSGLLMADLIRPVLAPIPQDNQVLSSRPPVMSDGAPIATDPVATSGPELPRHVGRGSGRIPPRWEMDRVKAQIARLPAKRQGRAQ
jgi:hypothetical protein